jgi:tetratricopeptide (TPR) repeat protein
MRRLLSLVGFLVLIGTFTARARADDVQACRQVNGDDSIAACTRLIASKSLGGADLAEAYLSRGSGYARFKRDYDRAIADYGEALRLDSRNARVYAFRGGVYVRKGNLDRALADLTEAKRLDPKLAAVYSSLGALYNAKGDYDRAVRGDSALSATSLCPPLSRHGL